MIVVNGESYFEPKKLFTEAKFSFTVFKADRNLKIKENILFQLYMCWQLYLYNTDNIEEPEALWAFSSTGLQVRKQKDGWCIDWSETESSNLSKLW